MQSDKHTDPRSKALAINLDNSRYGTFAEIGAGQEVVRWFFRVGGAAGTIAKSISAYAMKVSDAIYGTCSRYVCRERLQSMLDYEQRLNKERLTDGQGHNTAFFTFADTVSARNYKGTNECHGWMGIKFQAHPRDDDNQIIIHVRMLDESNSQQQEALGIVGVNLVYGACFLSHNPKKLVESLLDGLTTHRIEIDMIEFKGIEFRNVDNRLMSLELVRLGLSNAAMFGPKGEVMQPSEALYKKPIIVERGSFRPVMHVNLDMIQCAEEEFSKMPEMQNEEPISIMELTMKNLLATGEIDYHDFLARADILAECGKTVMISNFFEYYRLAAYLSGFSKKTIGIVMGAHSLVELFNEKYYTNLAGGILESFGRLFKNEVKLFIYPFKDPKTGELTFVNNLNLPSNINHLYNHLLDRGNLRPLDNYNPDILHIFSRDILKKIQQGDPSWEEMTPAPVTKVIKNRRYFGYIPENFKSA